MACSADKMCNKAPSAENKLTFKDEFENHLTKTKWLNRIHADLTLIDQTRSSYERYIPPLQYILQAAY